MRLFVSHRSEYRFSEPQLRLVQLLRLTPGSHAGQSVLSWSIDVDRDARLKPGRDGHGNDTTMLYVDGPIDSIAISVSGEVLTEERAGMLGAAAEPLPPLYFRQPTAITKPDAAIAALAAAIDPAADGLGGAHRLTDAVHARLSFRDDVGAHERPAAEVFDQGDADARDAAHVLIAAARAAGYPARYAAGHLYRPDAPETHAAHGWAELHVDGYGWIGFDAFEGCCPTDHYIRVAVGLDHGQAAPVSGLRTGGGGETMAVDVRIGTSPQ